VDTIVNKGGYTYQTPSAAFIASHPVNYNPKDMAWNRMSSSLTLSFSNQLTLLASVTAFLANPEQGLGKISAAALIGRKGGVWGTSEGFEV